MDDEKLGKILFEENFEELEKLEKKKISPFTGDSMREIERELGYNLGPGLIIGYGIFAAFAAYVLLK